MCGIFGYTGNKKNLTPGLVKKRIKKLFILSESRGKEASGLAVFYDNRINVYKENIPASKMVQSRGYRDFFKRCIPGAGIVSSFFSIIGHSRLVTDGSGEENHNNQPVIKDGIAAVHNGIVTNVRQLYLENPDIRRKYEVDTEILLSLVRKYLNRGDNIQRAISQTLKEIEGTANIALLANDMESTVLATNNGSLYLCPDDAGEQIVFTSEKSILQRFLKTAEEFAEEKIQWIKPYTGVSINYYPFRYEFFSLEKGRGEPGEQQQKRETPFEIKNYSVTGPGDAVPVIQENRTKAGILEYDIETVNQLKRCTKCILPATFPFIVFDSRGECNYCRNYQPVVNFSQTQAKEKLKELQRISDKYRKATHGEADIIVPFSGGRDSSYGLHYIKTVLGMKPITFTYDWGMVTDLARRNIARLCGKLGIENIIISADIKKKRKYIRQNVLAWLKKPEPGIVPLFMAGDKYFLYYVNKLKKETGIDLNIWMGNRLEQTHFKVGFAGVAPRFEKKKWMFSIRLKDQVKLGLYYLGHYFLNPRYLNSSLLDTLGAYYVYYTSSRKDTYLLYDYVRWDEKTVNDTLIDEYNWETSPDTGSTWRIGDGTASFYNYIYFTTAGFSEIDTFRSNQIREGMITREQALKMAQEENRPRYESIKWYCDIIGVDFEEAINRINRISRLYKQHREPKQ
jgi:glucosamine--fructose-6-phosphate aminotransferase (isomerizing)